MPPPKLYMLLLGCRPPGRHVEQHDFFFGIAPSLKELVPQINNFWREAVGRIHIDAWREVNAVDGYRVSIVPRTTDETIQPSPVLFFINLGGYQEGKFEEQHYVLLTAKPDKATALKDAKTTAFFRQNTFGKAVSHVDNKYGIDVDDLYDIEDILSAEQTTAYSIVLTQADHLPQDEMNLGYLKLSAL